MTKIEKLETEVETLRTQIQGLTELLEIVARTQALKNAKVEARLIELEGDK